MIIRCETCGKSVRTVDKISIFEDYAFCSEGCREEWNARQDLIDSGVDMDTIRRVIMNTETELYSDGR